MKGDPIPSAHHLGLHCQPSTGMEFDSAGAASGITREAFRIDEDGISSNWQEFDNGDFESMCSLLAKVRTVRKSHRVGLYKVGSAEAVGVANDRELAAVHDPIDEEPKNPGHALLTGAQAQDENLLDQLAILVELHPFPESCLNKK